MVDDSKNGELLLIERIRKGDEHAFEIAFLKYHTPLSRYIWKYVQSEEIALEIVQEVFAQVWKNRLDLDTNGHLRGFLFKVARNKALDHIKHQKIVDKYISETKKQKRNQNLRLDSSEYTNKDFRKAISNAVEELPPRGRQIFKLNRQEGLTYKEISKYLDISIKTVETHMRRVFKKLRVYLAEYAP